MNRMKVWVTLIVLLLAAVSFASAAVNNPSSLSYGVGETRDLSSLPAQSAPAQGGNVTELNIEALTITQSWQGYYGNITGTITLDDASGNTFYNWTVADPQGEVYASRNQSADFTTTACAAEAKRASEMAYLSQVLGDGDSVVNTFNTTDHPQFNVSTTQIALDSCFSTNAFTSTGQDTSRFHQVLLADGSGTGPSLIYTTIIDAAQTGFNTNTYDFELLVGENEKAGHTGSTPYYFFVELD